MSHEYKKIVTRCDLSLTGLEIAAIELKPSRVFILHVGGGRAYWEGKELLHAQQMREDNPLHPYINLQPEPDLHESEWYLEDEQGNKCGSEGV